MIPTLRHAARWRGPAMLALVALLAACGDPAAPEPALVPTTLESFVVGAADAGAGRAWDGVVQAVQQADLSAQTQGRVVAVAVDAGDRVRAGQVLLRLTAVEQQSGAAAARAQLRAAEASAAEAQANYSRFAALGERQYVSRLQLDQARAARDAAVANRDAARAQLAQAAQQAAYTTVVAPFDGLVGARRVEPGETVAPGQPLMSVHAPGALRVELQLPQSQAASAAASGRVQVTLADGRAVASTGLTVFPSADPATHTTTVRIVLAPIADPPAPGTTAKVVFPAGAADGPPTLRIPRSALVQRGELSGVYVVSDRGIVLRQLRLGAIAGPQVDVLSGLKAGERVAVDPVAAGQVLLAQRGGADGRHD